MKQKLKIYKEASLARLYGQLVVSDFLHFVRILSLFLIGALFVFTSPLSAEDGRITAITPKDKNNPLKRLWSGYRYMNPQVQAIQDDDFENPGMLFIEAGRELWESVPTSVKKSCRTCHNDPSISMRIAGQAYPVYFHPLKKMLNLEQRINLCRTKYQKLPAWNYESEQLLQLTSFVRHQSRGRPVNVKIHGIAKDYYERGKAFYFQRRGLLNMSCANCHSQFAGKNLRAQVLSQGQSSGYPAYRLQWQSLGSLHRRFQACNRQVLSEPYDLGSDEYVNLELYLNWRGNGLLVETPAVRN